MRSKAAWCGVLILAGVILWILWGNKALVVTSVSVFSEKLPEGFRGFRILQVSDLHNDTFGPDNQRLLDAVREANPDIVVITGDAVDSYDPDPSIAIRFVRQVSQIAQVYFVPGNHEARLACYPELRRALRACGAVVLENETITLSRKDDTIALSGVMDPDFHAEETETVLRHLGRENRYTVLLAHRPELFEAYAEHGFDLVLAGHVHGGQFRLPLVGGLFAPDQGWFPKYDSGLYTENGCTMVVSRGLGNSSFPFRLNNRPELILVELTGK